MPVVNYADRGHAARTSLDPTTGSSPYLTNPRAAVTLVTAVSDGCRVLPARAVRFDELGRYFLYR
jgi:hypothetical protein